MSTDATSVLLERTKELLKADNPSALIPYLEEILVRLKGMNDKDSRETRSFCMYQIGASKLQMKKYPEAIEALDAFLQEFPNDSNASMAALMVAEAYAMDKDWTGAEKYAKSLMDENLEPERRMSVIQLLAEALYSQEKWKESVAPLREIFDTAEKPRDRNAAAIMLVTCYVKEQDFENFLKFLAYCDDSVRQNASLNVSLIEAGDQKVQDEDYANALVLYRTVLKGKERLVLYEKQNAELEELLKEQYVARVGTSKSSFTREQDRYRKKLERNKKAIADIKKGPGYDADLEMRIGRCYTGMKRNMPALTLYRRFYTENPKHDMADDSRFQAFAVLLDMQNWDGAIQEAYDYLNVFPTGKFADEVSLNQMQVFLQNGRVEEAQQAGFKALETLPNHRFIDQIKYLLGYIYFQKIEYADALKTFQEVFKKWPDSTYHEASDYWIAMCYLFLGQFEPAITQFTGYLENKEYPQLRFEEDASYRLGIALYGAGRYEDAEMIFRRFIENFPGSTLESEAYSMVGDLLGADGELEDALGYYSKALDAAISIDQTTYATFQSAKSYEALGQFYGRGDEPEKATTQFEAIVDMMDAYLRENGEEGNVAGAGFWLGKAYKAMGQNEKALKEYLETVVKFGHKPEHADIDMILRELIKENEEIEGGLAAQEGVLNQLRHELRKAKQRKQVTLALRLETLFAYITEGNERKKHVGTILAGNVEDAGPLTLLLMATEALERGNNALVHKANGHCLTAFEESEILVDVMNAELQAVFNEKKYDKVKELAEEMTNKFGYRKEIGLTRMMKANACRLTKDYETAIKTYKELFAIREWRGPLTPRALYWIGICTLDQGNAKEAFAFFQRVYVMYESHTEWAAKAYAGSVTCLEQLGQKADIISTYEEMVANEKIAATPEGRQALARLATLRPQGGQK